MLVSEKGEGTGRRGKRTLGSLRGVVVGGVDVALFALSYRLWKLVGIFIYFLFIFLRLVVGGGGCGCCEACGEIKLCQDTRVGWFEVDSLKSENYGMMTFAVAFLDRQYYRAVADVPSLARSKFADPYRFRHNRGFQRKQRPEINKPLPYLCTHSLLPYLCHDFLSITHHENRYPYFCGRGSKCSSDIL